MKFWFVLIGCLSGLTAIARADDPAPPLKIGAAVASQLYDQLLTVTGKVAQVTLRATIVFINLDQPYPDSPFAAVIHSKDTNQFNDFRALKGRAVEITGKVQKYRDRPEIVVEKPGQIFVSGGWVAATNAVTNFVAPVGPGPAKSPKGTNDLTTGVM